MTNKGQRKGYRFEVQGPNALEILAKANGGPLPEIKFFNMGEIKVAGRLVRCLRHGMAGAPGLELFGPMEEAEEIRAAIFEGAGTSACWPAGQRPTRRWPMNPAGSLRSFPPSTPGKR